MTEAQKQIIQRLDQILAASGGGGGAVDWGAITGTLSNQTDLQTQLDGKVSGTIAGYDALSIHGSDVASASTLNLDAATGNLIDVTGTTTINAITLANGRERTVRFTGSLTIVNNANIILPNNNDNISTTPGDYAVFRGYAAGVVRCVVYQKVNGQSLVSAAPYDQALNTTSSALFDALRITATLKDISETAAVDLNNRQLLASDGTTVNLDFSDPSGVTGKFKDDATTPTNTITVTGWIKIKVPGNADAWLPYYQ